MKKTDQIEALADKARNSISKYCFSECNAYCCRKGFLVLSAKEADLVTSNNKCKLKRNNNGKYIVNLSEDGCSRLKNFKCTVHKNTNRSRACKEFPLFIWKNKTIHLSSRCPAVAANLFYPYVAEFISKGYKLLDKK